MGETSTPVSYYDNPAKNLSYLSTLSKYEGQLYTLGYLQACDQFLESLTDTKTRLLEEVLDSEDEAIKQKLLTNVRLLDTFDKAVSERATLIRETEDLDLEPD